MNLIVTPDEASFDQAAAEVIAPVVAAGGNLLVATGNTPMGAYRLLGERHARGELDSSRARAFQLDAYRFETPEDPRSLYGWMLRSFTEPLGFSLERVVRLPGDARDPEAACAAFEAALEAAGGLDLAILGLGPNGHLGFNEPPVRPDAPTRVVNLTPESLVSNAVYWPGQAVPRQAITAGMNLILGARRVLLVARGAHKREILHAALEGPRTENVPASWLQALNERLTVVTDTAAWPEGGRALTAEPA